MSINWPHWPRGVLTSWLLVPTLTPRANTSLADASRTPDLQIGPYYQRTDAGTNFLGFRAHMDLPVLNDGMPLLRQREAELQQRTTGWPQLQTRANLEAKAAGDRYERARQLVAGFQGADPSELPIELQKLEEQFKANEVDFLRVMQARNSLIQSRRADLDSLNELLQAATTVTAASGIPLESLTRGKDVEPASRDLTQSGSRDHAGNSAVDARHVVSVRGKSDRIHSVRATPCQMCSRPMQRPYPPTHDVAFQGWWFAAGGAGSLQ